MYYYGEEVAQDYKQAAYWVEKAYNNGYEEAADFWNQMELEQYK
jgi:TPR repeat protein